MEGRRLPNQLDKDSKGEESRMSVLFSAWRHRINFNATEYDRYYRLLKEERTKSVFEYLWNKKLVEIVYMVLQRVLSYGAQWPSDISLTPSWSGGGLKVFSEGTLQSVL